MAPGSLTGTDGQRGRDMSRGDVLALMRERGELAAPQQDDLLRQRLLWRALVSAAKLPRLRIRQ